MVSSHSGPMRENETPGTHQAASERSSGVIAAAAAPLSAAKVAAALAHKGTRRLRVSSANCGACCERGAERSREGKRGERWACPEPVDARQLDGQAIRCARACPSASQLLPSLSDSR